MSLNFSFDLQFFGGGGGFESQQFSKRDPEPAELTNLRTGLFNKIYPGIESFNANSWQQAQNTASKALQQQNSLLSQLPSLLDNSQSITNEMLNMVRSGNIPSGLTDSLNASVNKELQNGLGSMLNGLASRGTINSSIASQGVNNLSQSAADAYNKNFLSAYQAALGGYGQALQGSQNNTQSLLSGVNALGTIPSQAYEGAYAGLMPAFNLWKAWQNSYDTREDYDTVATQSSSSCITGDTLVTLSDGTEIPVSELNETDEIRAWDFENGCMTSAPLTAFFKSNDKEHDVFRVEFEDGSNVGVVVEHLFFDITEGKFIAIGLNEDNSQYIGHEIAKVSKDGEVKPVKIARIYKDGTTNETYAPQTKGNWNYLTGGFITGNDGQLPLCNMFGFDVQNMRFDADEMKADLVKFPPISYENFKDIMTESFFKDNNIKNLSVAIGKGLTTLQYLREYIAKFNQYFLK